MVTLTDIKLDLDGFSRQGLLRLARSRDWKAVFRFAHSPFGRLRIQSVQVWKTWHGWHVLIRVKNQIQPLDLTFLQLALDSDVAREMLNRRRIKCCHQANWNLLFPYKVKADGNIISEETPHPQLSKHIRSIIREHQRWPIHEKRRNDPLLDRPFFHSQDPSDYAMDNSSASPRGFA